MCGSKHTANWTTSRSSLPCSRSLLSNVPARLSRCRRSIKKKELGDVGVIALCFLTVCVHIFACEHMLSLCVFLGGICSDVQSVTATRIPIINIFLSRCKIKPIPGWSWLDHRGHPSIAPNVLYSMPCTSKCGVWLGLVGWDLPSLASSVTINGLPFGITFPHLAVSFLTNLLCIVSMGQLVGCSSYNCRVFSHLAYVHKSQRLPSKGGLDPIKP